MSKDMHTILVVDDDEDILRLIGHALSSDFNVEMANEGREALKIFQEFTINLLLTDIYMPSQDGLDLIRQIRKIDEKIPIIVMSGGKINHAQESFAYHNINEILVKPFTMAFLRDKVKSILK